MAQSGFGDSVPARSYRCQLHRFFDTNLDQKEDSAEARPAHRDKRSAIAAAHPTGALRDTSPSTMPDRKWGSAADLLDSRADRSAQTDPYCQPRHRDWLACKTLHQIA